LPARFSPKQFSPGPASANGWLNPLGDVIIQLFKGGIMLIAGLVILVNFIIDLLYGLINPRIRPWPLKLSL
jgi:hypothetical protein